MFGFFLRIKLHKLGYAVHSFSGCDFHRKHLIYSTLCYDELITCLELVQKKLTFEYDRNIILILIYTIIIQCIPTMSSI